MRQLILVIGNAIWWVIEPYYTEKDIANAKKDAEQHSLSADIIKINKLFDTKAIQKCG